MANFNNIKKDFPVFQNNEGITYLDSAASSLTPQCVIDEIVNYYSNLGGVNVNRGVYKLSYDATVLYENARKNIASFINANEKEVIFTKGASESLNLVASSYGMKYLNEGDEVIVSELEHHSSILPWIKVCEAKKATLKYIPLKEGKITIEEFNNTITDKTKIVALTHVSNVLGFKTPIKEIIKIAKEKGCVVSVDGAQAIPHMKIDVKDMDCDFYSFSGHKMCGPSGIGILYGKKEILDSMEPIQFGGDMNDNVEKHEMSYKDTPFKFETGTPNIAGVIGLSKAIDYLNTLGMENIEKHEQELYQYAMELLKDVEGVTIYSKDGDTGVIAFNIDGVHPHDAASSFDEDNVCLRAGHHCAQLVIKYFSCIATLRASFYIYNSKEDVEQFVRSVEKAKNFFALF